MLKNFKCIFIFIIFLFLITSSVFAENISEPPATTPNSNSSTTPLENDDRYNDLGVRINGSYLIDTNLNGNAFISATQLTISPKVNNNGQPLIIDGDVFSASTNTTINSNVIYSNDKDKSGNYMIDKITSITRINGNVYSVATDTFTLDSGSVINGDLYVYATTVNINEKAKVEGNVFVFANAVLNLHGEVNGSVYATVGKYTMNYTANIKKDLALTVTDSANISGIITRDTKINASKGKVVTTSDFITGRNLFIEANELEFAGMSGKSPDLTISKIGDTKISSKSLSFNNSKNCIIYGNLDYATKSELTIPDGIVLGEITVSNYVDRNNFTHILLTKLVNYVALLIYVFIIILAFKHISPNFIEKLSQITTTNIFVGLGVGFGLLLLFIPLLILLLLTNFTIPLAFVLLFTIIFVALISIPLFILAIANAWESEKINLHFRILIITTFFFLIRLIPNVGALVSILFSIIAIGKVLVSLFYRKK